MILSPLDAEETRQRSSTFSNITLLVNNKLCKAPDIKKKKKKLVALGLVASLGIFYIPFDM